MFVGEKESSSKQSGKLLLSKKRLPSAAAQNKAADLDNEDSSAQKDAVAAYIEEVMGGQGMAPPSQQQETALRQVGTIIDLQYLVRTTLML